MDASKQNAQSTNHGAKKNSTGFKFKRLTQEKRFDPANPFTFWMKGTDGCNDEFEREDKNR